MQLLYPIGLLALTGLIIPVIIHLWSIKQGKTLKIGSIALLGESASASAKSIKINDLLLFLLRCLILILVAFVLAQPYLKKTTKISTYSGWILVQKSKFKDVYKANKQTLDSLLKLGFELHDFDLGFKRFELKDSLLQRSKPTSLSYSALFNQMNREIPEGFTVYLFTDQQLKHFDANLPSPNFKLVWKKLQNQDSLTTWKTIRLDKIYNGKSTATETTYSPSESQNLAPISVLIYDPDGADSKYIKAALNAISEFTKRKIEVRNWNTALQSKADVGFWLSNRPIDDANLKKLADSAYLLNYQPGKIITSHTTLVLNQNQQQPIALSKRVAQDYVLGTPLWADGYGQGILILNKQKSRKHFHFYSRFNPQWSDLVWNAQFVKALMPIVLSNQNEQYFGFEDHRLDQRVIDNAQFNPTNTIKSITYSKTENQSIDFIIWSVAFLALIVERVLSFRKKQI